MKKVHLKHIPMYILIAFLVASILFVFLSPVFIINKIQEDSKKPKDQREYIYKK
ncbi:hypothetical protein [Nitrosophilus kaiyonis]|uniref:hypothetical protein n=1 Tax=Nitrosophilus kaiyonis TaxID=2930200 RepID=UPI002493CAB0|nr:hypothetical protein [Nitrosophilus kaiyonis]